MLCHHLTISLLWADTPPMPATAEIGCARGGPDTLLRWLETQIGLQHKPVAQTTRIVRYGALLRAAKRPSYVASLEADLWGTAKSLLAKRDGLRLLGWDGRDDKRLPALARDLSAMEEPAALGPSEADRLEAVLAALVAGQRLPDHELVLREPTVAWPAAWRPVLGKLSVRVEPNKPKATAGKWLLPEKNLTWWRALSVVTAAEAAATVLSSLGREIAETVILCEDAQLAALLDDALAARGVPPLGAAASTRAHPVLQVLPLALGLLWEPADPERVLDFLMLPVGPLPPAWARRLAEALAERPGVGGQAWIDALDELEQRDAKGAKERRERVRFWISSPAGVSGAALAQAAVAERCGKVAEWALRHAAGDSEETAQHLVQLAAQAAALAELALAFPEMLSEPQLQRLVASVQEGGVRVGGCQAGACGPRWIQSLAELDAPCKRLLWFGVHSEGSSAAPWSVAEAAALTKAGLDMDFDERCHRLEREAERAGVRRITGPVLAIQLATAADVPLHPLWLEVGAAFGDRKAELLEDILADGGVGKAWPLGAQERKVHIPAPPPTVWRVDPERLEDRSSTSASELETRLACPLKWTFEYAAKLHGSPIAELPSGFLLRGNLSHDILEDVFGAARPKTAEEAARRAGEIFTRRVTTDAATLSRPAAARQRLELKNQLERAARAFFELVERGRYEIVGFEVEPGGTLLGKDFRGRLDCVLKAEDGSPALLDLKYAGTKKYRELIETGKALQLCIYSAALAQDGAKGKVDQVAAGYFIVDRARLWTPATGGLAGAREDEVVAEAPSLAQVWKNFAGALKAAEGWLDSGAIPVRPLQKPEEWPKGAEIALREVDGGRASSFTGLSVCQYCAYPRLCGLEPVS
jgi:ATP-dependent helicase/nuclease subunit B